MRINYRFGLWSVAFCFIMLTILFKFKTGSFVNISEESLRKSVNYEIHKRKQDLTMFTLKESTIDMQMAYEEVMLDLAEDTLNDCVNSFKNELQGLPYDSAFLLIMNKMYEYAVFLESKEGESVMHKYVYHEETTECYEQLIITFEKSNDDNFLIKRLTNFNNYLACACKI